jgi:hypothetical protein
LSIEPQQNIQIDFPSPFVIFTFVPFVKFCIAFELIKTIIEIFRCTERSAVDGVEETRGRRKKENEDNKIYKI